MSEDPRSCPYKNGYWKWDYENNILQFVSRETEKTHPLHQSPSGPTITATKTTYKEIKFKETIDVTEQVLFRKYLRRKVKIIEPDVVTIQDLKDLVIYMTNIKDLSVDFINFFHTKGIDKWLRSLIVYFQFYFQVWENMVLRRDEVKRKLRQPLVTILENKIRDNIADLRSIVARDYSYIILGLNDCKRFYHLSKEGVSLSDKDRYLWETLLALTCRVVWIALQRKYLTLIELEINRLFRTDIFNPYLHKGMKLEVFATDAEEQRVLLGTSFRKERKLLHRSPAAQELLFGEHDYKLLATTLLDFDPSIYLNYGSRLKYLEACYAAPEEQLLDMGIGVGILGVPRGDLDPTLKPRKSLDKKIEIEPREIPPFKLPEQLIVGEEKVCKTLSEDKCKFRETRQTIQARIRQRKLWRKYVENRGEFQFSGAIEATSSASDIVEPPIS